MDRGPGYERVESSARLIAYVPEVEEIAAPPDP